MRGAEDQARGYPSDLTDEQWQVIAVHLPPQVPGRRGRPRTWPLRRITEAILYLDRAGCAWRYLPVDFPPWRTVYGYFAAWRDDGTLARLHDGLYARVRAAAGRDLEPTAAVIDSQSVRAADTVPRASRGWDNAKKVNGRKRHIAVDTTGLLLAVVITAASVQDRDAARPLLWNLRRSSRRVRLAWADAVYSGSRLTSWAAALKMTIEVVARRSPHTFEVLPRRWVVERTFAWISKHRRTVRDYERLPASHEAMILWAMIALMARRLAQPAHLSNTHLVHSYLFWIALIFALLGLYILPSVIAAIRGVEGLGWIIVINLLPTGVGWLAALIGALMLPRRENLVMQRPLPGGAPGYGTAPYEDGKYPPPMTWLSG